MNIFEQIAQATLEMNKEKATAIPTNSGKTGNTQSGMRPPSDAQMDRYLELCAERGVTPDEDTMKSAKAIYDAIAKLYQMPRKTPVSDKQKERIAEYCAILGINEPDYTKLEGGYNKSASQLIQKLKEMVDKKPVPLTEEQYEAVLRYQICPDVNVCDLRPDILEGDYEAFKGKMTKQEATEFLTKYKNAYVTWFEARITNSQLAEVKRLCEMMGTPFSYEAVIQLDKETAITYIDQLQQELAAKPWSETSLEPEDMYAVKTKDDDVDDETAALNELRGFCSRLYIALGQEPETEVIETLDFTSLKELIDLVRLYGTNVEAMMDRMKYLTPDAKLALLA